MHHIAGEATAKSMSLDGGEGTSNPADLQQVVCESL